MKQRLRFNKYIIKSKKWTDFFYDSHYRIFLKVKANVIKQKIYVILRPKMDDGCIYISNSVDLSIVENLFEFASTSDLEGNAISENKYNDIFDFEGITDINDFDILIIQNIYRKDLKRRNWIWKYFLYKNREDLIIKFDGETSKSYFNWFEYKYFVDKKTKKIRKNIFFTWIPSNFQIQNTPFETNYVGGSQKQWDLYNKMVQNRETIWNELAEKGINIMKIDGIEESEILEIEQDVEKMEDEK